MIRRKNNLEIIGFEKEEGFHDAFQLKFTVKIV